MISSIASKGGMESEVVEEWEDFIIWDSRIARSYWAKVETRLKANEG